MISGKKINYLLYGLNALAIVPSVAAAQKSDSPANDQRPNVLFIAIDDMKPWISPYGDKIAHTPGFDRLAQRGVTFNNAYCQVALSGPTRSSLLTGLNPDHTGVWWLMGSFRNNNPDIVTMPQALKENGYENDFTPERQHHEIYLSDARRVAPEKWKTVIRHPIKPSNLLV